MDWETLDAMDSADQIAEALKRAGIRGCTYNAKACPLARATGWTVKCWTRWNDGCRVKLTPAERAFVKRFDTGYYPELDADGPESRAG